MKPARKLVLEPAAFELAGSLTQLATKHSSGSTFQILYFTLDTFSHLELSPADVGLQ